MSNIVHSFKLGRSVVVTIPKSLGIKAGEKFAVQKQKGKVVLKPVEKESPVEIIERLAGGMNLKEAFGKDLSPDELNQLFDEQYKEMLKIDKDSE